MSVITMAELEPERMTALDVARLTDIERIAILTHLAGDLDPAVAAAVVEATHRVLIRTRPAQEGK